MADCNDWNSPPHQPKLESNDIHVWRLALSAASIQAETLFRLLANDEVQRAQRFHFQHDHDRFVVVRAVLRILLGSYIQLPPEQIRFQYSTQGRPSLAFSQNGGMLDFNLSHSHQMALLAFARCGTVGVDLEYVRPNMIREQVAEHFFSPQEIASLRSLPDSLQLTAFFSCWTRKEAFIKATGEGLSKALDQFSMSLFPGEAARLLAIQGQPEELSEWFVQDLQPGAGYAAALVARHPVKQVHCWTYSLFC